MKNLLLAAVAATSLMVGFMPTITVAQTAPQGAQNVSTQIDIRSIKRGKPGKVYWNVSSIDEMSALLRAGQLVCEGGEMQASCITFSRVANELTVTNVGRQLKGVGTNIFSLRVIRANSDGDIVMFDYDQNGRPITNAADSGKVENAAARWTSGFAAMPAAFVNGGLQSLVNATIGPCANGQCGGGGGSVAYAISGAEATALLEASLGGCVTGVCAPAPAGTGVTTPPPAHTTQPNQGN